MLLLRHLFIHLDGSTSGPNSYTGKIGNDIKICETMPIVKFKPIKVDWIIQEQMELSTDQKLLLILCNE